MSGHSEDKGKQPEDQSPTTEFDERRKDGAPSRMRAHNGNVPVLPQTKLCPHCPAKFTRTTHLNRHLRTHTGERLHRCNNCDAQFTRSDLLTRHQRGCGDSSTPGKPRRRSCKPCAESKIKCDLSEPCSKCVARGRECVFAPAERSHKPRQRSKDVLGASSDRATRGPSTSKSNSNHSNGDASAASNSMPPPPVPVNGEVPVHSQSSLDDLFRDLQTMNAGNRRASPPATDTETEDTIQPSIASTSQFSAAVPINSHLSSTYSSDMFEPLFSTLFNTADVTMSVPDDQAWLDFFRSSPETESSPESNFNFPFTPQPHNLQPFMADVGEPMPTQEEKPDDNITDALASWGYTELSSFAPAPLIPRDPDLSDETKEIMGITVRVADLYNYIHLFLSAFLYQIPIAHRPTFRLYSLPTVLSMAMKGAGALFVRTPGAAKFVHEELQLARETMIQEYAKKPGDAQEQIYLIMAVAILQTIGLFHQKPDQRTTSTMYHGMLVMMIRRSGAIAQTAAWEAPALTQTTDLHGVWLDWTMHEQAKRTLLLSLMHDACHSIYFALRPSFTVAEFDIMLPCEEELWKASTANEWYLVLQRRSPYGDIKTRLTGVKLSTAVNNLYQLKPLESPPPLSPFAHFMLIHVLLSDLCMICSIEGSPSPNPQNASSSNSSSAGGSPPSDDNDAAKREQQVYKLQFAMHNWLSSWLSSPDLPKTASANEEPPFVNNALPYYWLGQVCLLAYQEGIPPFERGISTDIQVAKRFRLMKQWLNEIRIFLRKNDSTPTMFWDELMKIRLQNNQPEEVVADGAGQDGLLEFFPAQ